MKKKGYSFSGWTEGILLTMLFIVLIAFVVGDFNLKYDKSYSTGFGDNVTLNKFVSYERNSTDKIKGGEAEFTTSQGLTLKSSWDVIKSLSSIIRDFLTGNFIPKLTTAMKMPIEVGIVFRVLYILSLVFSIIWILFKRKP